MRKRETIRPSRIASETSGRVTQYLQPNRALTPCERRNPSRIEKIAKATKADHRPLTCSFRNRLGSRDRWRHWGQMAGPAIFLGGMKRRPHSWHSVALRLDRTVFQVKNQAMNPASMSRKGAKE